MPGTRPVAILLGMAILLTAGGCDRNDDPAVPDAAAIQLPASPPPGGGPVPAARTRGGMIGKSRPAFSLTDVEGRTRSVDEWDGRVLVLNFWATWCPPCRREIPAFVDLQEIHGPTGLQLVGIAIDERDQVLDYMDTMGVNYPMLIGSIDAIEVSRLYGNRFGALPYTVIIDRRGRITFIQRGELTRETAQEIILPLLAAQHP